MGHVFSMSVKVSSLNRELRDAGKRNGFVEWLRKTPISKLWIESYRHGEYVGSDLLAEYRDYFRSAGFAVSAMVTPTCLNDPAPGEERAPFVVCWSDGKARERLAREAERVASLFGETIVDDFLFSSCTKECPRCLEAYARSNTQDWALFKRELMRQVSLESVVGPARKANPSARTIVKFPCWYRNWADNGYDCVSQPRLFGACWAGTETRDANKDAMQGVHVLELLDGASGGRCLGGWYDALDCTAEKFIEQARYTILGGAKESLIHCYDYLLAEDPGITPFGEKASRSTRHADMFCAQSHGLAALAAALEGAEALRHEWVRESAFEPAPLTCHVFKKGETLLRAYQNTSSSPASIPQEHLEGLERVLSLPEDGGQCGNAQLPPHGFALFSARG